MNGSSVKGEEIRQEEQPQKKRRYRLNKKKLAGFLAAVFTTIIIVAAAVIISKTGLPASAAHNTGLTGTHGERPSPVDERKLLSGKAVLIDAGHGGFDPGAEAADGTHESDLNLSVAKKLKTEFEEMGARVIMTRTDDSGLGSTQTESLRERRRIIEANAPDLVISVHMNSFSNTDVSGPLVLYSTNQGKEFALNVQQSLNDELEAEGNSRYQDLYVPASGNQPAILVECGYISNPDELNNLKTAGYQTKIAEAVVGGAARFLSAGNSAI